MATRLEDVPADLVVDFDVDDPALVEGVHERLAAIRRAGGIAWCPAHGGYWLVTRYQDVDRVMRDDEVFSAEHTALPTGAMETPRQIPLHYDPPEHTAYRRLLNPMFSPGRIGLLEGNIRQAATALLDAFSTTGACEFVSAFARPLPTATFVSLMGWPPEDAPLFSRWSETLIVGRPGASEGENDAVRVSTGREVADYFAGMVAERRRDPDVDDVTGHLLRSRFEDQRPLTDDEVTRMLTLLMVGGLHTVRGTFSFGMIHLAEHPATRRRLVGEPGLIRSAVEEFLRYEALTAPGRVVVKPVTLGGVRMEPGDRVISFLAAANRDPDAFDGADEFRVDRPANRHLTFAVGRHRCLGAHLARLELTVGFEEILRRIPDFAMDGARPPRMHASQIRGVRELHLVFTPERPQGDR
jgi:cytochrome P450